MSQPFQYTSRACRSISQLLRPSGPASVRFAARVSPRHQTVTKRGFASCRPFLAEVAAPSSSATANAATTESSLQTEASPLPSLDETDPSKVDWSRSFHGLSQQAFPKEAADILLAPIDPKIIEIKPDGIIYLPEIHYRRILNRAFGPGAWGLAPRGETIVTDKAVTREYALVAQGRLVSVARGEQDYFSKDGIPTASEGCKSNAMVRCCKDLGIASELWDPRFIREWKAKHTREAFVENVNTKRKTKIWLRKGDPVSYPFKETNGAAASASSKP